MTPTPTTTAISDREVRLVHTFRAPAARIFAAYTDPKQVPQWWGYPKGSLSVASMDVRVGGSYRFLQKWPDGRTMASIGSYLEVEPPTRLVYTFQIEGQPGTPVTTVVDLAEAEGKTTLTLTLRFGSKEAKDMAVQYGAVAGAKGAFLQLAEFVEA
jgi:uncharacterized protein YndB with AHSA1/START domain